MNVICINDSPCRLPCVLNRIYSIIDEGDSIYILLYNNERIWADKTRFIPLHEYRIRKIRKLLS